MIPEEIIQEIISKADIVDIAGRYVSLKLRGASYIGLCPFHSEKTPSFHAHGVKQIYHCFGCGAHGSVINFIMNIKKLSFIEAVEHLAAATFTNIPSNSKSSYVPSKNTKESIDLLKTITQHYQNNLKLNKEAIDYLKKRGLSGKLCLDYKIGYSCKDKLVSVLNDKQIELAKQLGILGSRNGILFDKFRNRVMFPITNTNDRVLGFGARTLSESEQIKYLNSSNSLIFNKSKLIYGLSVAIKSAIKSNSIIVTEGYIDVLSLAEHGITNVVSTLGTSVTEDQIELLFKYVDDIILCMDGDKAGKAASWKIIDNYIGLLRYNKRFKFLLLDNSLDPDEYIRQYSSDTFKDLLEKAIPSSRFIIETLLTRYDINIIENRVSLAKEARDILCKINDKDLFDFISKDISLRASIDISGITRSNTIHKKNIVSSKYSIYKRLAKLLFANPNIYKEFPVDILMNDDIEADLIKDMVDIIFYISKEGNLTSSAVINELRLNKYYEWFLESYDDSLEDVFSESEWDAEYKGAMLALEKIRLLSDCEKLKDKFDLGVIEDKDKDKLSYMLKRLYEIGSSR